MNEHITAGHLLETVPIPNLITFFFLFSVQGIEFSRLSNNLCKIYEARNDGPVTILNERPYDV